MLLFSQCDAALIVGYAQLVKPCAILFINVYSSAECSVF